MIEINDISFRYPGTKHDIYSGFSLTLSENRIYGVLGKNGTGKSTLLYLISGLLRPGKGSILVDGMDTPAIRRNAQRYVHRTQKSSHFQGLRSTTMS